MTQETHDKDSIWLREEIGYTRGMEWYKTASTTMANTTIDRLTPEERASLRAIADRLEPKVEPVDWPTSAGYWYCKQYHGTTLIVEARVREHHAPHQDIVIYYNDKDGWGSDGWRVRMSAPTAKYWKCPPNPF